MRLYEHAVEQPLPPDGVAGEAIRHLHSHMLPWDTRHLGNQVVCMIAEYHLTSSTRVSLTLSPVLLEAAKPLLPALKTYVPNILFEGTRDMRVLDCAKALRVAVWLHRLDMSIRGDEVASETLDMSRHCLGCLLESFLVPATHGLTFREVMAWCLYENRHDVQHRLISMVWWQPTRRPPDPHERGSRTWTSDAGIWRASRHASPMRSPTSGRTSQKVMFKMTCHTEMLRPRCLPMPEPMMLPPRVPWLQSLALLLVGTLLWRSTRGLLAHLPPVLSLGMMMTFSPAMSWLEWRRAWPTSQSRPPVDMMRRERKPHAWRCLPLWRTSNCRTDDRS